MSSCARADLDSLTSSLLYSYIRSATHSPAFGSLYIPIANIPAADINLRPEFLALLPKVNLEPSHLITLDDLASTSDLKTILPPENTHWVLVDHNALQGVLGALYGQRLIGVIDHHDEENKVPRQTHDEPRIIEKSGSCTSLVIEYLRDQWRSLEPSSELDAEVAMLGMASVLIDTVNLSDKSKTTAHDTSAVQYLESKLSNFDQSAFYAEIQRAKQDIGSMSLQDILRKDYKEWSAGNQKLGIATVVKPLQFLVNKASSEKRTSSDDSFLSSIKQFAEARKLDIFGIMTAFTKDNEDFHRELLLCAYGDVAVASAQKFTQDASSVLGLAEWTGGSIVPNDGNKGIWIQVWVQRNVQHSRKTVAPLLRKAMDT